MTTKQGKERDFKRSIVFIWWYIQVTTGENWLPVNYIFKGKERRRVGGGGEGEWRVTYWFFTHQGVEEGLQVILQPTVKLEKEKSLSRFLVFFLQAESFVSLMQKAWEGEKFIAIVFTYLNNTGLSWRAAIALLSLLDMSGRSPVRPLHSSACGRDVTEWELFHFELLKSQPYVTWCYTCEREQGGLEWGSNIIIEIQAFSCSNFRSSESWGETKSIE